jgi:hypothetical protein
MKYIQGLTPSEVKEASTEALKALKDGQLKAAVEAMSALKGVQIRFLACSIRLACAALTILAMLRLV